MIAVPVVSKASTSPSPANAPPAIDTVALVMAVLSGSEIDSVADSVTAAPFSVKLALVATVLRVGAASSGVIVMVLVCAALRPLEPLPSLTTQLTVRVGLLPWLVGSAPE